MMPCPGVAGLAQGIQPSSNYPSQATENEVLSRFLDPLGFPGKVTQPL